MSVAVPALTGLLVSCHGPPGRPDSPRFGFPRAESGQLARLRGHLAFIRCGGPPDTLWIADTPDHQVDSALAGFGDGPLPALVRLDGGVVTAVRFVAPEGPDCSRLPADADFTAQGTEPFWHLSLTGDSAVVSTPEQQSGLRFADGRWDRPSAGTWRFLAVSSGGADTLSLLLVEERCRDGMSGAWFPFRVTAKWGGRQVIGCGLEGRKAMRGDD